MLFKTDKQTTEDLAIFSKRNKNSVFELFNMTLTAGGAKELERMFQYPLADKRLIEERTNTIRFFARNEINFPFKGSLLDTVEEYIANNDNRTRLSKHEDNLERKIKSIIGAETPFDQIKKGVNASLEFLKLYKGFILQLKSAGMSEELLKTLQVSEDSSLQQKVMEIFDSLYETRIQDLDIIKTDQILRFTNNKTIYTLTENVYKFDALVAVAKVSLEKGLSFATPASNKKNNLTIEELFHPLLQSAVPNTFNVNSGNNMIFLTGANMAGKSTFMKSIGISVYLAHMGFPVPAKSMEFSVLNGLYTTINLPDNIGMGYSHFYAEVLRVKKVANSVGNYGNMLIIFDELFRGTNVKDAYEATVAVSEAFAGIKNSTFIISSHIIEAGETLKTLVNNMSFIHLPTKMNGKIPQYTYKVKEGISSDRHGMLIINNEGIPQMLGYNPKKASDEISNG